MWPCWCINRYRASESHWAGGSEEQTEAKDPMSYTHYPGVRETSEVKLRNAFSSRIHNSRMQSSARNSSERLPRTRARRFVHLGTMTADRPTSVERTAVLPKRADVDVFAWYSRIKCDLREYGERRQTRMAGRAAQKTQPWRNKQGLASFVSAGSACPEVERQSRLLLSAHESCQPRRWGYLRARGDGDLMK